MFTVVIAEKEYLDSIKEYSLFLKPFINDENMAFCEWFSQEDGIDEMVPDLKETVADHDNWRAMIISNDGIEQKNPFDLVQYTAPIRDLEERPGDDQNLAIPDDDKTEEAFYEWEGKNFDDRLKEYLQELHDAKFKAYEQAAQNSLTKLTAFLTEMPMVSAGKNNASEDPEFDEYLQERKKKNELIQKITKGRKLSFCLPNEILCISKRTFVNEEYDIPHSWEVQEDILYSDFCDRNIYSDKLRFLLFDICPINHRQYAFELIKFMYTTLLIANNELPQSCVKPRKVYVLKCENDSDALDEMLSRYDAKLANTIHALEEEVYIIQNVQKEDLTDKEASQIFCSNVNVPVTIDSDIKPSNLRADKRVYGLSRTCPEEENIVWGNQYRSSKKTLHLLLKQPRRALKRATTSIRKLCETDCEKAGMLNEYQIEDINEHIAKEEILMVETDTATVFDTEQYDKKMEESNKDVRKKIKQRMSKKTTIILGVITLALYLFGFIPLIIQNVSAKDFVSGIWMALIATGALGAICFITLFFLRMSLRKKIRGFNEVMSNIYNEIDGSLKRFSIYLSHACNVMRGFSVVNYLEENGRTEGSTIAILRNHIADLKTCRAETNDIFGRFMTGKHLDSEDIKDVYEFDFDEPRNFLYDLPYQETDVCQVEFIEPDNYVTLPVGYVKSISIKREELYDD